MGPLEDKWRAELLHDWQDRCKQGNFKMTKRIGEDVFPLSSNLDQFRFVIFTSVVNGRRILVCLNFWKRRHVQCALASHATLGDSPGHTTSCFKFFVSIAIERKIARAVNLMEHMSMQHYLWKSELRKARRNVLTSPGDALITAACVCYHGPLEDKLLYNY
jgi:hypothetical protein